MEMKEAGMGEEGGVRNGPGGKPAKELSHSDSDAHSKHANV